MKQRISIEYCDLQKYIEKYKPAFQETNFLVYPESRLDEGINNVITKHEVDILCIVERAFHSENSIAPLDHNYTFSEILDKLKPINKNMKILFITRLAELKSDFDRLVRNYPYKQAILVEKLNKNTIIDLVQKTYNDVDEKESIQEVAEETIQETSKQETAIEPIKKEPINQTLPPIVKKTKQKSPKKPKRLKLLDIMYGKQIILVSGNENCGKSSTACSFAKVFNQEGLDTVLIDLDLKFKGTNLYFPHIDDIGKNEQLNGVMNSLNNIDDLSNCLVDVDEHLQVLSTATENTQTGRIDISDMGEEIADIISSLIIDNDVIVVDIPWDILVQSKSIIRQATKVVFCTEPNINSIYKTINKLSTEGLTKRDEITIRNLLQQKSNLLFTNNTESDKTLLDWVNTLVEAGEEYNLNLEICGSIPHYDKFDNYDNSKKFVSDFKGGYDNIINIIADVIV